MIEELHKTGEGICANCGGRIVELTGWQSEWTHDAGDDGVYHRECPGTLYATPRTPMSAAEIRESESFRRCLQCGVLPESASRVAPLWHAARHTTDLAELAASIRGEA